MSSVKIRCVCLEEDEVKKDGKLVYKCVAVVGTAPWKVYQADDKNSPLKLNDSSTKNSEDQADKLHCVDGQFANCPRLNKYIEYTRAANTLNVKQQTT